MTRIRRRRGPIRQELSGDERFFLLSGAGPGYWDGREQDLEAAREDWQQYRDELMAERAERGLIPWAARHFDGATGKVSIYEDLKLTGDDR